MSQITTPDRSLDQRHLALSQANEVRSYRAAVKRTLRGCGPGGGRRTVAQIIMDPPPKMFTMAVGELLLACPRVGTVRVHRMLGRAGAAPSKTLGGLTQRQRLSLREELL